MNHLEKLVADLDTGRVCDGAVRLLDEVGMAVLSKGITERLCKADIRCEDGRMYITPDRTTDFIRRQRARMPPESDAGTIRLHSGGHCLYEYAPEDDAIKRLTTPRLELWTRLIGALYADGDLASEGCPGAPGDCPPHMAPLQMLFTGARFLKNPPIYAYSAAAAPYAADMGRVLGKPLAVGVHPISPLILGGEELELAVQLADQNALGPVVCAPMPTMGVTAPLDWVAAWAQSVAEAVGTCIALEALGAADVSALSALYVADMRHGAFVFGSPEHAVVTLAEAKVNREVLGNARRTAKAITTTAKEPGVHAATEKAAHTLTSLLGGYRDLGSAGVLATDEIFSPEQLIMDLDIVEHAWRIVRGVETQFADGDVLGQVREGLSSKEFLTTETTLDRFHDFAFTPRTFDRRSTSSWLASPAPEKATAWEIAQEKIAGYSYELDEERQRELRRIMDSAARQLVA